MRRQAKESSAGPNQRQATGLGRILRGAFASLLALLAFAGIGASSALADGNVEVGVTGQGRVTSTSQAFYFGNPGPGNVTPGEIDCDDGGGPVCSANFASPFLPLAANYHVTLTATPGPGQVLGGWDQEGATSVEEGCQTPPGTPETCVVRLNGNPGPTSEVTANFVPPPIELFPLEVIKAGSGSGTVTSFPLGIDCGTDCVEEYFERSEIRLDAIAGPDSGFAGWSGGGCSGMGACAFTLGEDTEVTATFHRKPAASTDGSKPGTSSYLATLEGTVDPNQSQLSDCRFLYGPTTDYGESAPCAQTPAEIGSGDDPVAVSAETEPLEPDTVYHFRLRATKPGSTVQGKDRTFITGPALADSCPNADIRAAQGIEVTLLPECMALEQVSPPRKGNQHAYDPRGVSPDGARVSFVSIGTLSHCPNQSGFASPDRYLGLRGSSSWAIECLNLPFGAEDTGGQDSFTSPTPDLSRWFNIGTQGVFQRGVGGFISRLSPPFSLAAGEGSAAPAFRGATQDHTGVYLTPNRRPKSYLPDDPFPSGDGEGYNTYIAEHDENGNPSLTLLARDKDGKVWGGDCGVRLGGMEQTVGEPNLPNGERNQGAISVPDGDRVYFSTRAAHPDDGSDCTTADRMRIMVRSETPAGPVISELIESECDRPATPDPPGPCLDEGDDLYQGASIDQTKVYFLTNRQLVDADVDGTAAPCVGGNLPTGVPAVPGCDLYLWDATEPAGQRLTLVSEGDATAPTPGDGANVKPSIAAISADGSRAYFVAEGVLTTDPSPAGETATAGEPNFYAWDAESGETDFIGTVATNDGGFANGFLWGHNGTWSNGAYPVPIAGGPSGGDGHVLLFKSLAPLTADDEDGAHADLFRYDAEAKMLERVSKAAPGGADDGPVVANQFFAPLGTDYADGNRPITEDGETVVFKSAEALVPGDNNGLRDLFLWSGGDLVRLPGSADVPGARANPVSISRGGIVAYHSPEQLTASDGDSALDVYVARPGGGFPFQTESVCQGEACQGAPESASPDVGAASAGFSGRGNLREGPGASNCVRRARKARALSRRAKRLRRNVARVSQSKAQKSKRLNRRARAFAKRARRQSKAAKRCRRARAASPNRRANR